MISLIVSGVFWAGLMLVDKLCKPSERWNSREEEQQFHKDQEQWVHGGWMLYR